MQRIWMLWTVAVTTAAANGDGFVPVSQSRSIDAAGGVGLNCKDSETLEADDFTPFDETVEISMACENSAATAASTQTSTIGESALSVTSEVIAETELGENKFLFLLSMAGSTFDVTVELDVAARVRFSGTVVGQADAEMPASYWVTSSASWSFNGEQVLHESIVQPGLGVGSVEQSFEFVQHADPGTYRLFVENSAGVTDAIPVTGSFHASSEATVELFHLADLDLSGVVGVNDLLMLLAQWGSCVACIADIDANGVVDVNDLLILLSAWGATGP